MARTLSDICRSCTHLVLDFDGVLADSEPLYRRSWNLALSEVGHSVSEDDYWLYWSSLGEGLEGEAERAGLDIDDHLARRMRGIQREAYERLCLRGEVPMAAGAERLLSLLVSGRAVLSGWAVASNTDSRLVRAVMERAGAPVPDHLVGGEGLRRKPAPDIFLRAASLLDAEPEGCLVVEDSVKGIRAARAGGFPVVRMLNAQNRRHSAPADADVGGLNALAEALLEREGADA